MAELEALKLLRALDEIRITLSTTRWEMPRHFCT